MADFLPAEGKESERSGFFVVLPPAVAEITHYGERSKGEVQYTGVHTLGGLFTQLLGCFSTYRTLG
jgi:hypothetical protein